MGSLIIQNETPKNPLSLIGRTAGVCWGASVDNKEKNVKRAKDCISSGHGRVLEWVDIYLVIDGYSARVIREFERHHIGASFLQESTRYVNESGFDVVVPRMTEAAAMVYYETVMNIRRGYSKLIELGVKREDAAMLLPLGMTTKIVDKRNLRNLVEMSHQRMCTRAYWEYRELMKDICTALSGYSDEWKWIVDNLMKPKCEVTGFCTEEKTCGRKPRKLES